MSMSRFYKRGFTLIEVVVALALGALILVAASSLLMSITQLWIKQDKLFNFQGHIHGVKTFLQKHIKESYHKFNEKVPTVQWSSPPRISLSIDETFLSFPVRLPNPLFPMDNLLPVVCYLKIDKEKGLSIIWHSFEEPKQGKEQEVYETEISPWAKRFKLHYYDESKNDWDVLDKPRESKEVKGGKAGKFELPDFLEIQFEKEGEEDQSSFIPLYGHNGHNDVKEGA